MGGKYFLHKYYRSSLVCLRVWGQGPDCLDLYLDSDTSNVTLDN